MKKILLFMSICSILFSNSFNLDRYDKVVYGGFMWDSNISSSIDVPTLTGADLGFNLYQNYNQNGYILGLELAYMNANNSNIIKLNDKYIMASVAYQMDLKNIFKTNGIFIAPKLGLVYYAATAENSINPKDTMNKTTPVIGTNIEYHINNLLLRYSINYFVFKGKLPDNPMPMSIEAGYKF